MSSVLLELTAHKPTSRNMPNGINNRSRLTVGAAISRPQSCDPVRVYRGAKKMPFLLSSLSKGSLERVGDGVLDVPRGGESNNGSLPEGAVSAARGDD